MRSVSQILSLTILYSVLINAVASYTILNCSTVDTDTADMMLKYSYENPCTSFGVRTGTNNGDVKYVKRVITGNVVEYSIIYVITYNVSTTKYMGLKFEVDIVAGTRVVTFGTIQTNISAFESIFNITANSISAYSCAGDPNDPSNPGTTALLSTISSILNNVTGSPTLQTEMKEKFDCLISYRCRESNYEYAWNGTTVTSSSPFINRGTSLTPLAAPQITGCLEIDDIAPIVYLRLVCTPNGTDGGSYSYLGMDRGSTLQNATPISDWGVRPPTLFSGIVVHRATNALVSLRIMRYQDPLNANKYTSRLYAVYPNGTTLNSICGSADLVTTANLVQDVTVPGNKFIGFGEVRADTSIKSFQVKLLKSVS